MAVKQKKRSKAEYWKWGVVIFVSALLLLLWVLVLADMQAPPGETTAPTAGLRPNPYSAEDFGYTEGYLTCLSGSSWLGIDVSHHQGTIRWQEVADAGVAFAMVRLGYRTTADGRLLEDRCGGQNLTGARNAGLKLGVYFYSQAVSVEEAREEALFLLELLQGMPLEMPVVFDWEVFSPEGRTAKVDDETMNACAAAFCEEIRGAGYQPMVYFNRDIANRLLDLEEMNRLGYGFWLAMYSDKMTWPYAVDMWQYTDSGKVAGIDGPVDINLYFPEQ